MASYRVTFFKHLVSSDGHPFNCPQRTIDIRSAKNSDRAIKAAQLRYGRLAHCCDWKLRADEFRLETVGDTPDRRPGVQHG